MHKRFKPLIWTIIMSFGLQAATIDTVQTYSHVMDRNLTAIVVIPDSYVESEVHYPVVYLLHGYGGGPFDWINHLDLRPYADQYQMLIICPDGDKNSWYLDSPIATESQYATYVGKELVRWVDDHYRTIVDRNGRAITGLSMGGHGAFYLAVNNPTDYCAVASMSGGVDLVYSTVKWEIAAKIGTYEEFPDRWEKNSIVNMIDKFAISDLKMLIDCGIDDIFIRNNRELHQKLQQAGIEHQYIEKPGGHSWDYWTTTLPEHLKYFALVFTQSEQIDRIDSSSAYLAGLMNAAVADSAWPGGVLLALQGDQILVNSAFGFHTYAKEKPVRTTDIFDLASITKVVSTTSAVMKLYDQGLLDLNAKVVSVVPEFRGKSWWGDRHKAKVRIKHLLTHTAGLPPFKQYYKIEGGVDVRLDSIYNTGLEQKPRRETVYSDIGIITMGKIIERITRKSLAEFVNEEIFNPLGMHSTGYKPSRTKLHRIVPTEIDPEGKLVHGFVHDENAHSLGGVAGHAGLFSTAGDLAVFARMMLNSGELDGRRIFQKETIELFTRPANIIDGSSRCLGWDSPSGRASGGVYLSDNSFGHTGFTGTSLWIDPDNDIIVILLTNAVHPNRSWKSPKYYDWRQRIHSAVYEELGFVQPNPNLIWRDRWQKITNYELCLPTEASGA
ncbi:MAG: serine hydrolase [Candidatus Marinimicrobia bacterium]|nr:serine hydrolase [Candidatus Neomarinimicrobiota bacterium]